MASTSAVHGDSSIFRLLFRRGRRSCCKRQRNTFARDCARSRAAAMRASTGSRASPRMRSAPRAPAKLRIALARRRAREIERRHGLQRLRLDAEGKGPVADIRDLHGAVVVAREGRARQELHQACLHVRQAIREAKHEAPAPGCPANVLDQLLERVRARPAKVVALAARAMSSSVRSMARATSPTYTGWKRAWGHGIASTGRNRESEAN